MSSVHHDLSKNAEILQFCKIVASELPNINKDNPLCIHVRKANQALAGINKYGITIPSNCANKQLDTGMLLERIGMIAESAVESIQASLRQIKRDAAALSLPIEVQDEPSELVSRVTVAASETLSLPPNEKQLRQEIKETPLAVNVTDGQLLECLLSTPSNKDVGFFLQSIRSESGLHRVLKKGDSLALLAFSALLEEKISEFQCATFCLFYSAMDQFVKHPIFYRQLQNEYASSQNWGNKEFEDSYDFDLHIRICNLWGSNEEDEAIWKHLFGNERWQELSAKLRERLRALPLSEQTALLIPVGMRSMHNLSPILGRISDISSTPFVRLLMLGGSDTISPQAHVLVPSFSILKIVFDLISAQKPMDVRPVIGDCTPEFILEHKKKGVRIVQVSAPFAPCPKTADGFATGGPFAFTIHDGYHLYRDNLLSQRDRDAILYIISFLQEQFPSEGKYLSLEGGQRQSELGRTLIWGLADGELHNSEKSCFGALFETQTWKDHPIGSEVVEGLMKNMVEEPDTWSRLGISKDDLLKRQKGICKHYEREREEAKTTSN